LVADPYLDPRTGILRNRLGITDEESLRAADADISTAALFTLELSPHLGEGHFDFTHLRALHVHLFGELYSWAGKPRTVDIAKGSWFCLARNIEDFAASVFRDLAAANYLVGLDRPELVQRVAELYGQLNALHPFREGNGRTQRAFLTQLGRLGGWRVRWSGLDRATNDEASRRSLDRGDDTALAAMFDDLLEEVPRPPELAGTPRRVVLAVPPVAAGIPGGIEPLRAGPYPGEATCVACRDEYALADEPTVMLLRPLPPDTAGIYYAHARCARSRVLPPPSARELRAWLTARAQQGLAATGAAVLLLTVPPRASLLWRMDQPLIRDAGGDVVDLFLNRGLALGLRPAATTAPPDERTPGWVATVLSGTATVTVTDPEGRRAFFGEGMDLPPGWLNAVSRSGECAIFLVSRGEIDPDGLDVAIRQGRVVSGLAAAVVDPP
jgi:cell filamentation protein